MLPRDLVDPSLSLHRDRVVLVQDLPNHQVVESVDQPSGLRLRHRKQADDAQKLPVKAVEEVSVSLQLTLASHRRHRHPLATNLGCVGLRLLPRSLEVHPEEHRKTHCEQETGDDLDHVRKIDLPHILGIAILHQCAKFEKFKKHRFSGDF